MIMKTTPILFSTEMVQAILAGNKTQTRRILKISTNVDILEGLDDPVFALKSAWDITCPYGQPGDILWVRETFAILAEENGDIEYAYKADKENDKYNFYYKPSIHMPKAACRLFLKIKSIRVERLQDINEADAIAEGVEKWPDGNYKAYTKEAGKFIHACDSYRTLWQKINGPESWDANPYVWVVEFEKTDKPNGF